jgi:type II secretory pathway component PulM
VTLSDRDRRILLIILPVVVVIAYWFLLLSPKRADLSTARDEQTQAEQARDQAVAQAAQLEKARQTFAADYAAVVRLGKAIPDTVDSPSLLVQLDRASKGTHIDFTSVTFGARSAAVVAAAPATQAAPQPNGNAAAGGAPAQTGPGTAAESAGNAVNNGNQASSNVDQASGGTTTTTATGTTSAPATATPAALDSVALTFNFTGTYFDLADFFHRLKRFVYVANNQIFVRGRLMTIDTLSFAPKPSSAGGSANDLSATVGATVYLAPKAQGATGGATPQGPAGGTTTPTTPSGAQTSSVPLATAGVR